MLLLFSLSLFACTGGSFNRPLPTHQQMDEAISNLLKLEPLKAVFKSDTSQTPFSKRIVPYIFHPEKVYKTPPPVGTFGTLQMAKFYTSENNLGKDKQMLFSTTDTTYFRKQIDAYKTRDIDTTYFADIKLADYDSILNRKLSYYKVNVPLFSADHSKVFIELDHYHYGGGWGQGIILAKQNGEWVLLKRWMIWGI